MKTLGLSVVFLWCWSVGLAQCTVDLGADIHVCQHLQDVSFPDAGLGNAMTITNGTPPYQYQWSITPIESFFGNTFYASTFLDDTTLATPTVLGLAEDSLTFYLQVVDAIQQVCYDTIIVSASIFNSHLASFYFSINAGDSVQLFGPNIGSNYPVDSIVWYPDIGMDNPNAITPRVSPPSDQYYGCMVWDSQGCSDDGGPFQSVEVLPVGINNPTTVAPSVTNTANQLTVVATEPSQLTIWNVEGKLVLQQQLPFGKTTLPLHTRHKGVFLYALRGAHGTTSSGKLIVL